MNYFFGLMSLGFPNISEKNQKNTHLTRPKLHFPIAYPKKPKKNIARKKMIKASKNGKPQIIGIPTDKEITKISNKSRPI